MGSSHEREDIKVSTMSGYNVSIKASVFIFLNRKNNLKTRAQEKKKAKKGSQALPDRLERAGAMVIMPSWHLSI